MPVATNCRVVPFARPGFVGVTWMETRTAEVTVRSVLPVTLSSVAEMVVEPISKDVARPLEPAALLTDAIDPVDELQVTCDVRSCVESSEKMPVAVNWVDVPMAAYGLTGVTWMETSAADVTVS